MLMIRRSFATFAILLAAVTFGCAPKEGTTDSRESDAATSHNGHNHDGGEHAHEGGESHGESGGHGGEADGPEHKEEHGREGEGEHAGEHAEEGRGEHDRDGGEHGEEGEESGTEYKLTDKYDDVRNGAHLILAYDAESNSFVGTVENTTEKVLERVRVEVHLSSGKELGPTMPKDLKPGEKVDVKLTAESKDFDGWSAHPEVGNEEHGHGGEHGENDREHDGESSEHGTEGGDEHE